MCQLAVGGIVPEVDAIGRDDLINTSAVKLCLCLREGAAAAFDEHDRRALSRT